VAEAAPLIENLIKKEVVAEVTVNTKKEVSEVPLIEISSVESPIKKPEESDEKIEISSVEKEVENVLKNVINIIIAEDETEQIKILNEEAPEEKTENFVQNQENQQSENANQQSENANQPPQPQMIPQIMPFPIQTGRRVKVEFEIDYLALPHMMSLLQSCGVLARVNSLY